MAERCLAIRNKILGCDHPGHAVGGASPRRNQAASGPLPGGARSLPAGARGTPPHPGSPPSGAPPDRTPPWRTRPISSGRFRDARQVTRAGSRGARGDGWTITRALRVRRAPARRRGRRMAGQRLAASTTSSSRSAASGSGATASAPGSGRWRAPGRCSSEGHASKADTEIALQSAERAVEADRDRRSTRPLPRPRARRTMRSAATPKRSSSSARRSQRSRTWRSTSSRSAKRTSPGTHGA